MTPRLGSGDKSVEEGDRVKPVLFCVYTYRRKEGDGARVGCGVGAWLGYGYVSLV